ncbi:O-antigen ligase family protein [Candidatus Microgenomates bacterium]|nr:O-antigen ligase family protein [Candidatus Microgenomates bacterium]
MVQRFISWLKWWSYFSWECYVAKSKPLPIIHNILPIALFYSSLLGIVQFLLGHTLNGPLWWLGERTFSIDTPGIAKIVLNGQDYLRAYATFPHPNALAGFLLVGLILMGHKLNKWLRILIILAIVLTFSHSVWLAGIVVLLYLKWQVASGKSKPQDLKTNKKISDLNYRFVPEGPSFASFCVLIFAIAFSLLLPFFSSKLTSYFASPDISQRLELATTAGNMIKDNFLFGVGLNNFIVSLPEYSSQPDLVWWLQPAHNIFLLVFAET